MAASISSGELSYYTMKQSRNRQITWPVIFQMIKFEEPRDIKNEKSQWSFTSPYSKWPSHRNKKTIDVQKDVGKGYTNPLLWDCRPVQPLWKTLWRCLRNIKTDIPYDVAISFTGKCPNKMKSVYERLNLYSHVYSSWTHKG